MASQGLALYQQRLEAGLATLEESSKGSRIAFKPWSQPMKATLTNCLGGPIGQGTRSTC